MGLADNLLGVGLVVISEEIMPRAMEEWRE